MNWEKKKDGLDYGWEQVDIGCLWACVRTKLRDRKEFTAFVYLNGTFIREFDTDTAAKKWAEQKLTSAAKKIAADLTKHTGNIATNKTEERE